MTRLSIPVSILLALAGMSAAHAAPPAREVTIYRCVGADGEVVIGNQPCAAGEQQQVRTMVRPVDAIAPAAKALPPAAADAPPAPVRIVIVAPAAPTYECTRPDGSRYESDNGSGEPRWVPEWSTGYPIAIGADPHGRPGGARGDFATRGATVTARDGGLSVPMRSDISIPANPPRPPVDIGRPRPPPHPGHGHVLSGYGGGNWEYDSCEPLPQAEACARLRDRRDALRTRFFNAQQVERDTLRVEERGLNARIDSDCRTY
ncbi:DUF4124 domain-containing protein [Luteimonas sp. MC1572]|uniref:DUF4124 domain-containing protein n=1 Tax=Luteimonas sp. MC1572 TaxID=2799325 RepID=UPI0018F0F2DE|nr:DUF4124 domain-containing protein [Luteimonas sp. MC1572]MBJ6981704.1 DUF4124 domain-containing protein [Luteimonas sp. MC1572]QQO02993.1 DUF4124 domain-containing protein [Luteimonas sp. MC1572]